MRWYDNVPLLSWFLLRGKCRSCGAKFSFKYVIVELLMGVLFAVTYYRLGWSFYTFEILIFVFMAVSASFIDLKHYILPDKLTLTGLALGLLGSLLNPERSFWDAFLGGFVGGGVLYGTAYLFFLLRKKEGMGGGDIKLLAWIGAIAGLSSIPVVLVLSSFAGVFYALLSLPFSRKSLSEGIPFGPFLVFGALSYIYFGPGELLRLFLPV